MAWHDIFVSRRVMPDYGDGPMSAADAESMKHLTGGNCPRAVARDCAQNAIRFGPNGTAVVFAGKQIGRLVYVCSRDESPLPVELQGEPL